MHWSFGQYRSLECNPFDIRFFAALNQKEKIVSAIHPYQHRSEEKLNVVLEEVESDSARADGLILQPLPTPFDGECIPMKAAINRSNYRYK